MEMTCSSLDIIKQYDTFFRELKVDEKKFNNQGHSRKLVDLIGGLGITNSIHEKFIKCIIAEYEKVYELSSSKKSKLIKAFKSPKNIGKFALKLQLDLSEAFELNKENIKSKYAYISDINNLISSLDIQRTIRNNYLHGECDFENSIEYDFYCEQIIRFQEIHNFMFEIFRYSFINNIHALPEIDEILN